MNQPPFIINIPRRSGPISLVLHFHPGKEKTDMPPVSQDVADFCTSIGPAVTTYTQTQVDAALAKAGTAASTAQDKAVADALAQVTQDHNDEIAALKDALAKATAPAAPPA